MTKKFRADLHIHTCLSPCADIDMSPAGIVKKAIEKSLDIIAVTDHNSGENAAAALKSAEDASLTVLAGMEITSSEEAHILALFDSPEKLLQMQALVYDNLIKGENDENLFGEQVIANEKDEVMGFNKRLLIGSTAISAVDIVNKIHDLQGIAIASHIDRSAFSIISQLGFIPGDLYFDALELSSSIYMEDAMNIYNDYNSYPWITSSDAHRPDDIGTRTTLFYMEEPTFDEIKLALKGVDGRKVEWE